MNYCKAFICITVLGMVTGCATAPEEIAAIEYPDAAYSGLSCQELTTERMRVQDAVLEATGQQRSDRKTDQAWAWTGAILFFPALLLMDGNDENATRLAKLKGQYESLHRVAAAKRCSAGSSDEDD